MKNLEYLDEYYTLREAAEVSGFSVNAVRNWILTGKMEAEKRKGQYWIHPDELERMKVSREPADTAAGTPA